MFLLNSRLGLFTVISMSFSREGLHKSRYPFSRSYGVSLPSSLTRVISSALEYSSYLPVSDYGTSRYSICKAAISWQYGLCEFTRSVDWAPHNLSPRRATGLNGHIQPAARLTSCVTARFKTLSNWCWNINQLPIGYAFRPRLRVRLTLGGLTFPRKP